MGDIIAGAEPIRDETSKWYTPTKLYPDSLYPTYVSGTAYVISVDLIPDLHRSCFQTELFWIEDVYITGLCARNTQAVHIYNAKFGYKKRLPSPCLFQVVITAHRMEPFELLKVWGELRRPDLRCDLAQVHWTQMIWKR